MNLHFYTSNLQQNLSSHGVCVIAEIVEHILKGYATPHCDLKSLSKYVQQFRQLHKHRENLNFVANWKCKNASSHHSNLMINSLLIQWSSHFIWFRKSYDQ